MTKELKIIIASFFFATCFVAQCIAQPLPPASSTPLDPASWVLLGFAGAIAGKKYFNQGKEKE